jgi:hypothetical protein
MPEVKISGDTVHIGNVGITFHRTLRIPDDGGQYPLPPSLGAFPLCKVSDYAATVPESWDEHGGVFLPMYQREAMWLSFTGAHWRPNALKIAIGKINVISGKPWNERLSAPGRGNEDQDYVVLPWQPWLDGINAGDGFIKQFVAMPLGMGYTVEGQVSGQELFGGIQLCVFEPRAGRFPEHDPVWPGSKATRWPNWHGGCFGPDSFPHPFGPDLDCGLLGNLFGSQQTLCAGSNMVFTQDHSGNDLASSSRIRALGNVARAGTEMGLAPGGRMRQKIYPDPYGIAAWNQADSSRIYVHICNSEMYEQITGKRPPVSPISAATYTQHGYPWFDLYDERRGDVSAAPGLAGVRSVKEKDSEHGFHGQQDDESVVVGLGQVQKQQPPAVVAQEPALIVDGQW